MENYSKLTELIRTSDNIVFFGGAGVSTESDIPDFRGSHGLYSGEVASDDMAPEEILHRRCLATDPARFFGYYRSHMLYPDARPNPAHHALAALETMGKLTAVVTQNIDGLHQKAGSRKVIELHGSTERNYCVSCGRRYGVETVTAAEDDVPHCPVCGGLVRPDVVLYGEPLDGYAIAMAEKVIREADVLIVGGTSLTVQPAAGLIGSYEGEHLVIINQTPTPYDAWAELIIRDPIGEVLGTVMEDITKMRL